MASASAKVAWFWRQFGEQFGCFVGAADVKVVVGKLEAGGGQLRDLGHDFERLLGLVPAVRGDVQGAKHPIGQQVLGLQRRGRA